jgi:hypothetical protein
MKLNKLPTVLSRIANTPAHLMLGTWLMFFLFFFIAPLQYNRNISSTTIGFLLLCIGAFVVGCLLTQQLSTNMPSRQFPENLGVQDTWDVNKMLRVFALLGLFGAALVIFSKVFIGGLNLAQAPGELRQQLGAEADILKGRGILLWMGMLLYSFSNVAIIIYILKGEACDRITAGAVALTSFTPSAVILLYGGRSSGILVLVFGGCAVLIRRASGQTLLPKAYFLRPLLIIHLTLVVFGSLYIFADRALALGYSTSTDALYSYAYSLDATIPEPLKPIIEGETLTASVVANILMGVAYVTQSFTELDYLINVNDPGPFYGEYQGWLISKGLRVILGLPDSAEHIEGSIHHTGLFFSAWGGMFLDFGFWLSPVISFIIGLVAGRLYQKGIKQGSLQAKIWLVFMYMFILLSPIHSLLQMGNSLQTLLCLIGASFLIKFGKRKTHKSVPLLEPFGARS